MGSKQIRIGQLIAPFGPGSIYTDRRGVPHVVAGLDYWYMRWDEGSGRMVPCTDRAEFELSEPRLSLLLRVDRFCIPPDHRHIRLGGTAAPNAGLFVPALRFPRWYRHTKTGELRRFNLQTARIDKPRGGGRWQPVRFIAVCSGGHLSEFPWKAWVGCQCADDGHLVLTDRGGSELTSVKVHCLTCPEGSPGRRGRNLGGTTVKPDVSAGEQSAFQKAGITCSGERPWLGEDAAQPGCDRPLVGALINQTNIYFPRTVSALALPDLRIQDLGMAKLRAVVEQETSILGIARTLWNMPDHAGAVGLIQTRPAVKELSVTAPQIEEILDSIFSATATTLPPGAAAPADPELDLLTFRRAEFNILREQIDDPARVPDLRVIPTVVPPEWSNWVSRVNLVERVRETRAFYGFDRLEPAVSPLTGVPDTAILQLFRDPPVSQQDKWLPAVKVYGEGIYIELDEARIRTWQGENEEWINSRIDNPFIGRLIEVGQTLPPLSPSNREWASRYLLVHSLAHVLINQLVFECGYSTASLRERLYISSDRAAPMAAFLIYTAAGDSEGTLGGLVRLGRPERLGQVMQRALDRASWCSADPVCSEPHGGQGSRMANLAACHACILLPETSCETINQGLDRAMLVGTPDHRAPGFFSSVIQ